MRNVLRREIIFCLICKLNGHKIHLPPHTQDTHTNTYWYAAAGMATSSFNLTNTKSNKEGLVLVHTLQLSTR